MLHSITLIEKVYDTGQKPVLVQCNDLNYRVCKHNMGHQVCETLFAEWMVYHLLKALKINLPVMDLVWVNPEHVPPTQECQPRFFMELPVFGTQYIENALEWSKIPFLPKTRKQIKNIEDLMVIAYVDLWLANEDRNFNNFNLLLSPETGGYFILPIDHGSCFNTLSFTFSNKLSPLTENESIIFTDEFKTMAKSKIKNLNEANNLAEDLYLRVKALEDQYDEKALAIPKEWNISEAYRNLLKGLIFDNNWLNETKINFLTFLKNSLNLK